MKVIYKPTGQMGDIPDDKFDPSLFSQANIPPISTSSSGQSQSFSGQIGSSILGLLGGLAKPFVETGKTITTAATAPLSLLEYFTRSTGHKTAGETLGNIQQALRDIGATKSIEQLDTEQKNPLQTIARQAGRGAEMVSWGIPFGKGANILTKALLPGAAVAGLQALGQENATPESVVGNAALGATGAGLLHGLFGIGGKVAGKFVPKLEELGGEITQGVRRITLPASIYGAQGEKEINKTLDYLGFKGIPQQQYEQLLPKMNELENKIKVVIADNPDVTVKISNIRQSFFDNLKSSLRSKDLTQKQVVSEVGGYINDLLRESGIKGTPNELNLNSLRQLKKLVNQDYGPVANILGRGGTLSPRQRVINAAWDSLDQAVKEASTEMKQLLKHESNLYKATPSLEAARFNPPTQRIGGTSIPGRVTQSVADIVGRGMQGTGKAGQKMTGIQSYPLMQLLGQGAARLPAYIRQQPQNENNTDNNYGEQNQAAGNLNQIVPPTMNIPQQNQGPQITPQMLAIARLSLSDNEYKKIKDIYDIQQGPNQKALPTAAQNQVNLAKAGLRGLDEAERILQNKGFDKILALNVVHGQLFTRGYDSAMFRAIESLLRSRSGAAVPETEVRRYMSRFAPRIGDDAQTVQYKLDNLRKDFEDMKSVTNQPSAQQIDPQQLLQLYQSMQ